MIRDRIVVGLQDAQLSEKLQLDKTLILTLNIIQNLISSRSIYRLDQ